MFCKCRDILVRFDKTVVLNFDRFDIPDGKISAIVGANGTGKTTLLEVVSLLRRPNAGNVRLWDKPAKGADRELQNKVVMVMHPGYMFRGNVWDNVMYGLKARGVTHREARLRAEESLRLVDMENLRHRNASQLSSGERQRVNLARAIVLKPQAIVLDEPTANVDFRTVEVIRDLFKQLRDENGLTLVHASPADSQLQDITDLTFELSGGKLQTLPQGERLTGITSDVN